ncbi:MAG: GNAT family N-acetyltransferase [SAR202 cluster bacterium]|jgi:predicted acetyltransferase|nr:GNAT family N-acetyltransferase [SAR202 cluster bacterium]HJO60492.1 GNAT family N-acetyltransferase [SAR202 cluster bacterium]|tara:strand:+ start:881 stop:2074 length:1194 start_codon:yes stop_codon:yes gene_type:complete
MSIELKTSTWDDFPLVKIINARGENGYRTQADFDAHQLVFTPERSIMAFDGKHMVGNALSYEMDMYIPGGLSKIAAVASVSVQATHRRKGINRAIMKYQLEDIYSRGEPLAVLQASESIIYGRYGYGLASFESNLEIEKTRSAYAVEHASMGQTYFVEESEAREIFPQIYSKAIENRNGMVTRQENWWEFRFREPGLKGGDPKSWFVKYQENGQDDGYLRYTINGTELNVIELIASSHQAYSSLWRICLDMDLVDVIKAEHRPADDELKWMLADPRRLVERSSDRYWVRLVDVRTALSQRSYSSDGSLILKIQDDFLPWNKQVVELSSESGKSLCSISNKTPDIILTAGDLGAVYLGGINFSTLLSANRIEEVTEGSVAQANLMFSTSRKPWGFDGW